MACWELILLLSLNPPYLLLRGSIKKIMVLLSPPDYDLVATCSLYITLNK